MPDELEGRLLSGFQLIELIGEGAHGSVWRARQTRLDRDVAVKILDPVVARNPETVRRFEREGRAAASLDHPNVVPVYEAGESDGLVFLAMRLVEGVTLEQWAAGRGVVSPEDAASLLAPVAEALDHAHGRDLVHRDVKPSNILLEGDRVWLADFGIAASLREMGSYTTGALGTAEYMAPEQASAGEVDHRADLYGLGCVAHFLMEGHPPFEGDDLVATLMAHVNEPVPSVGDAERDRFYARALAKDPAQRFETATDLIAVLSGKAVQPATSTPTPSTKAAGNRGRLIGAAALVVLALAAIFALANRSGDGGGSDAVEPIETTPVTGEQPAGGNDAGDDDAGDSTGGSAAGDDGSDAEADGGDGIPASTIPPPVLDLVVGGEVQVGTVRSLASPNPHVDRFVEPFVTGHVLPPLMVVESDWTLTPWLAAGEPEVRSTDPLVVRWTLRDDAVWDDGTPVTAVDVGRTLEYILQPDAGVEATTLYQGVTFTQVDELTFDLTFAQPLGAHRILFSTFHPVIKAAAYDAHIAAGNPPSTFMAEALDFSAGPYRVSGYDSDQRLTLVRNEGWWGAETPLLERVTIRSFDSARAQIDALESGDVDLIYVESAAASDIARTRAIEDVAVDVGVADLWLRLDMNTRRGLTSEAAVREAIALALDRWAIVGSAVTPLTGEAAPPLQSLIWPSTHPRSEKPFDAFDGDLDGARAVLQEAGWVPGDGGRRFRSGEELLITLDYEQLTGVLGPTVAQAIVSQLDAIGMGVQGQIYDEQTAHTRRLTGEYELDLVVDASSPDPVAAEFRWGSEHCPVQFGIEGCDSAAPFNLTGVSDAELDALLDAAASEPDPARRAALYVDIDARLAQLLPAVPLFELPAFVAHSDELGGVSVDTHRGGPFVGMAAWGYRLVLD